MKSIICALLMAILFGQVAVAGQERLYTNKGYPYKNLISKAEQVRIYYFEDDAQLSNNADKDSYINCRVEVNWADNERKTSQFRVEKTAFDQEPLASCLPRKLAKQYLADIYAD